MAGPRWLLGCSIALAAGCFVQMDLSGYDDMGEGPSAAAASCGDRKLDVGEECDPGPKSVEGCVGCKVAQCWECTPGVDGSACAPEATGAKCGASGACNGQGKCVECTTDDDCAGGEYCSDQACASCTDGAMNGDETGFDCGGSHCKACRGDSCGATEDCKAGLFCADSVCCDRACNEPCESCNLDGKAGTCTLIPRYGEDSHFWNVGDCLLENSQACSGTNSCLKLAGALCTKAPECMSDVCENNPNKPSEKICLGDIGEPCSNQADCQSEQCAGGACAEP